MLRRALARNARIQRERVAVDLKSELDLDRRSLLEPIRHDEGVIADDLVRPFINLVAFPVEGTERAELGPEVRMLSRHGSLAWMLRIDDLVAG
jgi:hypothetical protein